MTKVSHQVREYMAAIGRRGGKRSRRLLTPAAAKDMVRVREARRAFKVYYSQCFWSFSRDLKITLRDIPWVVEQLMKYGDREAWMLSERLCR